MSEIKKRPNRLNGLIKKEDMIIIAAAIILAAASWFLFGSVLKDNGSYVRVSVNSEAVAFYPLSDTGDHEVIGYKGTPLHFSIEAGKVRMISSDCPDKICIHHSPISKLGESIVCLPNRVVLLITDTPGLSDTPVSSLHAGL